MSDKIKQLLNKIKEAEHTPYNEYEDPLPNLIKQLQHECTHNSTIEVNDDLGSLFDNAPTGIKLIKCALCNKLLARFRITK